MFPPVLRAVQREEVGRSPDPERRRDEASDASVAAAVGADPAAPPIVPAPRADLRRRLAWAAAIAVLAAGSIVAVQARGRSARLPFDPPPELRGHPWVAVGDATSAFRVWRAAGIRGRWLVVLTGRWSRPRDPREVLATAEELLATRGPDGSLPEFVDAENALYAAAQVGIARRFSVAMTPPSLARRIEESRGKPDFEPESGDAFRFPFHGLARRFSTPDRLDAPTEPALVLVEPSFFAAGGDAPDRLLRDRGVSFDLALVALDDPAADDAQRAAARAFVAAMNAPFVEASE
jgi:hypothetical protein